MIQANHSYCLLLAALDYFYVYHVLFENADNLNFAIIYNSTDNVALGIANGGKSEHHRKFRSLQLIYSLLQNAISVNHNKLLT